MTVHIGTPCLLDAYGDPASMAARARRELDGVKFDTMVGTGFSGALAVPALARDLNANCLLLRKPGDSHHHASPPAEGDLGSAWLFVDDGIQTGATLARVRALVPKLAAQYGQLTRFAGVYIYGHDRGTPAYMAPDHWILHEVALAA